MPVSPNGRPTKYEAEKHPDLARKYTGEGKTLADLADLFDVALSTIELWQTTHLEFSVAIRAGREDATNRVEKALFDRAVGYSHPTVKPIVVSGGQGMGSSIEMVSLTEQYPPDTPAALAWLKNKRPAEWKDKQVIEHQGLDALAERLAESRKNVIALGTGKPADEPHGK
jgi:hypothetical protein